MLISDIKGSVLYYPIPHKKKKKKKERKNKKKNVMLIFMTPLLFFQINTGSTSITGHIKQHFITTRLVTYVTNGCQIFVRQWTKIEIILTGYSEVRGI